MNEDELIERPIIPKEEIQKKLLNILCSNSGDCITFGRFTEILDEYFENLDFKYLTSPITRIGNPSVNGFVNELIFQREEYKMHTILKSTTRPHSDSLAYEYLVGRIFINYFISKVPCFLKTYKCLHYENTETYNTLLENKMNNAEVLQNGGIREIMNSNELYEISCTNPLTIAILIQHIENPISLYEFLHNNRDEYSVTIDLLQILLQIYLPLGKIMQIFTHNDLHLDNILLYQIPNNQYVEMTYQLEDSTEITFKTKYIVKIIDYGRCYFNNIFKPGYESYTILKDLLKVPSCNSIWKKRRHLGTVGYGYLSREANMENYYSSALTGNKAKDLWAALIIGNHLNDPNIYKDVPIMNDLKVIMSRIQGDKRYGGFNPEYQNKYCTKENQNICNIAVFAMQLIQCYKNNATSFHEQQTRYFSENPPLGKMRIYMNLQKDMDFQLTPIHNIHPTHITEEEPPMHTALDIDESPMHTVDLDEPISGGKRTRYKRKKTKRKTTQQKIKKNQRRNTKRSNN